MAIFVFLSTFLLAVLALAPFGALILFCIAFREDRNVHPIYRGAELQMKGKQAKPQNIPGS